MVCAMQCFPRARPWIASARVVGVGLAIVAWALAGASRSVADEDLPDGLVRFGFSRDLFKGVNANDAQAAIKVWANSIVEGWDFEVSTTIHLFDGVDEIVAAFQQRRIEAITVTSREYWAVRQQIPIGQIILGTQEEVEQQEYLVVVRSNSGLNTLADLRGRSLMLWHSMRTDLAGAWLEVELAANGLETMGDFLGSVTEEDKLSRAVLPVFFGRADACLVTRAGLELMRELNPQLGRELRVITASEPYVASVCFFRADFETPHFADIISALQTVGETPAGEQVMLLFQQSSLTPSDGAILEPACDLLDRYAALQRARKVEDSP